MLFGDLDAERAAAEDMAETIFDTPGADADDLPPPAYQPQVAAFEPNREDEVQAVVEEAPEPVRAPGTPSPEALARLRAAAAKSVPSDYQRPVSQAVSGHQEERPRFGINSLINRMTGQGDTGHPNAARQQPPVQSLSDAPAAVPQDKQDPDQERIEIPAFLRRQAN